MLNVLRQKANSWFMILLFAIITIVFIFTFGSWGGGNVSGEMPIAAEVNGRVVSQAQFQAVLSNQFRRRQQYQPGYTSEQAQKDGLRNSVLEQMIGRELLAQAAEDKGMVVSDAEVIKLIKDRFFGPTQEFDRDLYRDRIVSGIYQTTEALFEEQIRRDILAARMESLVRESQLVPESELKRQFNLKNDRVNLKLLRVDPSFFKGAPKATEEEQTKWANENTKSIESFFNEHRPRYQQSKQVRARHILAKSGADEASKKQAREKAEAALKRVKGGEDFAAVAKEVSEDGSAAKGGDLGFFTKERMVKPFSDAAFAMKPGDISDIVESQFGFHVIKVEEVKEASMKTLDDVKVEIAKELMEGAWQKEQAMALLTQAINDLTAGVEMEKLKLVNYDGDLTKKEKPNAPSIHLTDWVAKDARYIPGVGFSDAFVSHVFGLTTDKPVSQSPIEVQNRLIVAKLIGKELPDEAKYSEEKEGIRTKLLENRSRGVVQQFIEDLKVDASITTNMALVNYTP